MLIMIDCVCVSHSVFSDSLWPHGLWPSRILCPWNSPGKNTAVGSCSLLQGIFQTQGLNPSLLLQPGEGKGYPLQYSGLENSMGCIVHGITRVRHDWITFIHSSMLQADSLWAPGTLSQNEMNTDAPQECKIARCTPNQLEMKPISPSLAP